MDLTGDNAGTILKEYEGYSINEMNRLLEENSITYHTMTLRDLKQREKTLIEEKSRIKEQLVKRNEVII